MIKIDKNIDDVEIPAFVPIIPVRNTVFFPHQFIPLAIGRAQKDGTIDDPEPDDLHRVGTIARILKGTIARILKVIDLPDGSKSAFIQGLFRFRTKRYSQSDPFFMAEVEIVKDETPPDSVKIEAFATNLKNLFQRAIDLAPEITTEHQAMVANVHDPGITADIIIAFSNVSIPISKSV
ncbi:hypothetical protein B1H10_06570 [candidate division KSB1 bacterium 4484_188]|nr:MAG: hypothetical protein B1H10_06570 [candidate division KSB1 bacterium 4484_188]